jgi:NADH-quinone oxidoreductase subunit M
LGFMLFASLGMPGLAHFAAEVQIVLGALAAYPWAAAGMLAGVLLTTAMFLWTMQRVLFGKPREDLQPLTARERFIALTLAVLVLALGVWPQPINSMIEGALRAGALSSLAGSP